LYEPISLVSFIGFVKKHLTTNCVFIEIENFSLKKTVAFLKKANYYKIKIIEQKKINIFIKAVITSLN
jgi:hypothetical protein